MIEKLPVAPEDRPTFATIELSSLRVNRGQMAPQVPEELPTVMALLPLRVLGVLGLDVRVERSRIEKRHSANITNIGTAFVVQIFHVGLEQRHIGERFAARGTDQLLLVLAVMCLRVGLKCRIVHKSGIAFFALEALVFGWNVEETVGEEELGA